MKEEISVRGKKVSILLEPHTSQDHQVGQQREYFTASYTFEETPDGSGVVLFLEDDTTPKRFDSPVQALEYASEKLLIDLIALRPVLNRLGI